MAEGLPPGFKLRKGLDGIILGLSIVFVVRVQMIFSSLIDWRLVPSWTYAPIKRGIRSLSDVLRSTIDAFTNPIGTGGSPAGVGAGGGGAPTSGTGFDPEVMRILVGAVGFPVQVFGALSANIIEQLLVILGFWIAFLVPLWFWGFRPFLFWWRSRGLFEVPKPD